MTTISFWHLFNPFHKKSEACSECKIWIDANKENVKTQTMLIELIVRSEVDVQDKVRLINTLVEN